VQRFAPHALHIIGKPAHHRLPCTSFPHSLGGADLARCHALVFGCTSFCNRGSPRALADEPWRAARLPTPFARQTGFRMRNRLSHQHLRCAQRGEFANLRGTTLVAIVTQPAHVSMCRRGGARGWWRRRVLPARVAGPMDHFEP
jgi:hypothetical protein